jgi:predicted dehydrogenase
MVDRRITFAVLGAGSRGMQTYGHHVLNHPEKAKIVAVAEPREFPRNEMARLHNIRAENVFKRWEDLLAGPKLADAIVVATPDRQHTQPAIRAARKGYHILLEKPMSPVPEECLEIVDAVKQNNVVLAVGHVLRYAPTCVKIKEIIDSGALGDVCTVEHLEGVGWWHQAHAFVRGNWRNSAQSSPMLLSKSCHDIDILRWWVDRKCLRVSSFGQLKHFRKECKPIEAASRCMDCVLADGKCPYSAKQIYFNTLRSGENAWLLHSVVNDRTEQALEQALREGPYGRCVYECDNDVVDHQVVNMEFEDRITVTFTMTAFTPHGRRTRIMGSAGFLESDEETIKVLNFASGKWTVYAASDLRGSETDGHGGGDHGLMDAFIEAIAAGDARFIRTGPEVTLESHMMVFAAERSRLENRVVCLDEMYTGRHCS